MRLTGALNSCQLEEEILMSSARLCEMVPIKTQGNGICKYRRLNLVASYGARIAFDGTKNHTWSNKAKMTNDIDNRNEQLLFRLVIFCDAPMQCTLRHG